MGRNLSRATRVVRRLDKTGDGVNGKPDPGPPVVEIRGGPGGFSRDSLVEHWLFREVLWALIVRHVKVKYKQAAVGVGWAVVQPVLGALLFAVFLGRLARIPSEGVPYLLFALAGMIAWTYFSTSAGSAMESLITDQALLRKVYFPREMLPLAAVGAALVDLAVGLVTLLVAAALFGTLPSLAWLALPLPILLLVITATAVGLGLSAVNVYYRDVRYALPFVLQLGLFASPVVYPLALVPPAWRTLYAILNPVAAAIDALRRIALHQAAPDWGIMLGALIWSTLLLVGAVFLFKRLERSFSDRV
jgi:lipopolysaccharide transport system permease protein